jgi:putative endonuclease
MPRKGSRFEGRAINELKRKGHKILARNVIKRINQHKKTEIDLVSKKGRYKYVGEVKNKKIINQSDIKKLVRNAKKLKGIPLLCISGKSEFTQPAKELIRKNRVKVEVIPWCIK